MVQIATYNDRISVETPRGLVDISGASGGAFGPDPINVADHWSDFVGWAVSTDLSSAPARSGVQIGQPPLGRPRQVVAVGLNYPAYVDAHGGPPPTEPHIFTKLPSAVVGDQAKVRLVSDSVSTEVELALVIAKTPTDVSPADALDYVAGATIAEDLVDNAPFIAAKQGNGPAPNLQPAKSRPGFAPLGPRLVTLDELPPLDALELELTINGVLEQKASTADQLFKVPEVISWLSSRIILLPGDVVLTGSPGYLHRVDKPHLKPGDTAVARISGIGSLTTTFV